MATKGYVLQDSVTQVTPTEVSYLSGVTSAIQTQLDGKATAASTMQLLASTTTGSALTTVTLSSIPAATHLKIVVYCPGKSGTDSLRMQFNSDSGANYGYKQDINGSGNAAATAQASILLGSSASTTDAVYAVFDIVNITANPKIGTSTSMAYSSGTTPTHTCVQANVWNDTAAQISSITVFTAGGVNTMNSGTSIFVYGSN